MPPLPFSIAESSSRPYYSRTHVEQLRSLGKGSRIVQNDVIPDEIRLSIS